MIPKHRIPTHPGEILVEEFLKPLGLTQVDLARHIEVPIQRVNEIARGKRGVSVSIEPTAIPAEAEASHA